MSRSAFAGPTLPKFLLEQLGNGESKNNGSRNVSRKDMRKAIRQQKKAARSMPKTAAVASRGNHANLNRRSNVSDLTVPEKSQNGVSAPLEKLKGESKPLKSILKTTAKVPSESGSDSEDYSEEPLPAITRAVKSRLADDDAEIEALEKKLGIKGKKSKTLELDGLDWIAEGSDSDSENPLGSQTKRKRPEDTKWLRDKRLKASSSTKASTIVKDSGASSDTSSIEVEQDGNTEPSSLQFQDDTSEVGTEDFETFDSEDEAASHESEERPQVQRQRENPYVPPVSKDASQPAKYVPPSLRKQASSDEDLLRQVRRQVQGLLNRLSDANILSIVQSLEDIYARNPRQHVTSTLIDLLVGLVADPATLNDTFLILHAAFSAAVYKIIGTDFGAHLIEKIVESFDLHYASHVQESKQALNILAFLSSLYTFQVVGSNLIFDYIRLLLEELSERNTELLLRVMRTSGPQLRQDDPSSLKDIVLLLQRSTVNTDEEQLSVRTKFMIETINDLKNNRMKSTAPGSAGGVEHISRMKKMLGSLNQSRSIKSAEPLRMTLSDIRDSDKKGKWWLIGASYLDPAKHTTNDTPVKARNLAKLDNDAGYESETPGSVNLHKLARSQGMNTDVRRALFVTILSSADPKEAHLRVAKLRLKSKQMLELPRVLIHCAGAEQVFNPFYAAVALQFCGDHRLRKAFEFNLWDTVTDVTSDDNDEQESMTTRKMVNIAKLYGSLIARGGLDLKILKKFDFTYLTSQTSMFAEVLLTTLFLQLRKKESHDFEKLVKKAFAQVTGWPDLIQGLQLFLENVLSESELSSTKKEKATVQTGRVFAIEALANAANAANDELAVRQVEGHDSD